MDRERTQMIAIVGETTECKKGLLSWMEEMVSHYTTMLVKSNDDELRGKIKGFNEVIRCINNAKDQLTVT